MRADTSHRARRFVARSLLSLSLILTAGAEALLAPVFPASGFGRQALGATRSASAQCDDLSDPGNPAVKIDWRQGLEPWFPSDYFDYDPEQYWVQAQTLHGTTIVVAIHESLVGIADINGFDVPTPEEFAAFVFQVFHQYWHVFNGFLYDRYTVKVNALSDPQVFTGASAVGLIVGAISSTIPNYPPHQYVSDMFEEFASHELFHAWNGGIIEYVPSGDGRLYQLETWIKEGSTVYYSAWVRGIVLSLSAYREAMTQRWETYESLVGTEYDLSIEELTFKIGTPETLPPPASTYTDMLYARSALLNYMLDLELAELGVSLDALMRNLYDNFGLTGRQWVQADIPVALEAVSGERFDEFFDTYLYTNAQLPLDGTFRFVHHPESTTAALDTCAPQYRLTVTRKGDGAGSISMDPPAIVCGKTCSAWFSSGASVTLTATAAASSTFVGWRGGGCAGTGACTVSMTARKLVTAWFTSS